MKTYPVLLTYALALATSVLSAQNLVPNGGFEEGVTCPTFVGNFDVDILYWYTSAINYNGLLPTPEWYHICSEQEIFTPPYVAFGNQEPFEGEGYAGFVAYSITGVDTNYREIIGVPLNTPLTQGESYQISFKLGRLTDPGVDIAINNIGFQFTTHQYFYFWDFPTNSSHFSIDSIIHINGEWLSVSESFVADSAYSFFHIGNFYDDNNTEIEIQNESAGAAYYIIDDVSISSILSQDANIISSKISVFPNPFRDQIVITSAVNDPISSVTILNLEGIKLKQFHYYNSLTEQNLNLEQHTSGTF